MGTPIAYISLHKNHVGKPEVKRHTKMGAHPHPYKISRTYYRHSTSIDFHCTITTVQGSYVWWV